MPLPSDSSYSASSQEIMTVRIVRPEQDVFPDDFHCVQSDPASVETYRTFFQSLNTSYRRWLSTEVEERKNYRMLSSDAVVNALCVAYFEKEYRRAVIKAYPSPLNPEKAIVYGVDLGQQALVSLDRIFYISRHYTNLPCQNHRFRLHGLNKFRRLCGFRNYVFRNELNLSAEYTALIRPDHYRVGSAEVAMTSREYGSETLHARVTRLLAQTTVSARWMEEPYRAPTEKIQFSSLVRVPDTGANWGTRRHPITSLEPKALIRLEITGIDRQGCFVVQPPATKYLWGGRVPGMSKLISKHLNKRFTKDSETSVCGCLPDGLYFSYAPEGSGVPVRCRLKNGQIKEAWCDKHWSNDRKVEVHLVDTARAAIVPICHLRTLPPTAASVPAQAALARWKASEK